jgi:hypothetical protein
VVRDKLQFIIFFFSGIAILKKSLFRATGHDPREAPPFAGGLQSFLVAQDLPSLENFKKLSRLHYEIGIFGPSREGAGTAEGTQDCNPFRPNAPEQERQKRPIEEEEIDCQIKSVWRQPGVGFQVDLPGFDLQATVCGFFLQLRQGFLGNIKSCNRQSPFGQEESVSAISAGKVQGSSSWQQGEDLGKPGVRAF